MLTSEQKLAVHFDSHLMLTACPGSGKTRVIVSKLARVLDEVRDTPRSVACITYTNTGVHEIEARLRHHVQPGDDAHYDVCTIHSFCLNHIFRPFCYLIKGYKYGFRVLTTESPEFEKYASAAWAKHGRHGLTFKDFEEFTQLRMSITGEPSGNAIEKGSLTPEVAKEFWSRIRADGFIDFSNIIYFSFKLLEKRPEILSYAASKFAWILVDEFQDTTDLQVEIFSLIAKKNQTKFFLVGDPVQSIFGFAGAQPSLADDFAKLIGARTDLTLSGNFRSSTPIINHANILFSRTPKMIAVGDAKKFTEIPSWQKGSSPFQVITDHFLPMLEDLNIPIGEAAILSPQWFSLFHLGRRLREYGVNVVGPGARPYRRNRQFAPLAEQVCGYLMSPQPDAIAGIERTLFHTLLDVTGRANFEIYSYTGRMLVFLLLECATELQYKHAGAIDWLEDASKRFSLILHEHGYFSASEQDVFVMSVEEMKKDMRANKVDIANLAIADLGVYASPDEALKLATLHFSKGREYSAVALIDLHEGKIPFFAAQSPPEIAEAKRLFYVGVTRAKRVLLYVTDSTDHRNQPTRFLRSGTGVGVC
jgi:DNA helicase-2/ATP-dependent DNA helicase PcrA